MLKGLQYRAEQTIPGTETGQERNGDGAGMKQNQNGTKTSELELSGLSSIPVLSQSRPFSGIVCSVW